MTRISPEWDPGILAATRLDRGVLDGLCEGDIDFLSEVVLAFCSELQLCLDRTSEDRPTLRFVAHTLKASAHYVGAVRCSRMAGEIELSILTNSEGPLYERWQSLQEEAKGLSCELRSLLRQRISGYEL